MGLGRFTVEFYTLSLQSRSTGGCGHVPWVDLSPILGSSILISTMGAKQITVRFYTLISELILVTVLDILLECDYTSRSGVGPLLGWG